MKFPAHLVALVALGSALGALARYGISLAMLALAGPALPLGTLAVNVLGSLLIGFGAAVLGPRGRWAATPALEHLALTGFCGGFTTFSVFSLETLRLLQAGRTGLALGNVVISLVLWLGAVWLGHAIGRRLDRD